METQNKSAIEIIQELIAIHTTRKEVADKLLAMHENGSDKSMLLSTKQQSDDFINELLPELSNFGDAVHDSSPRDNEYQQTWKNFGNATSMSAEESSDIFKRLEYTLKQVYQQLIDDDKELPASLSKLLSAQQQKLQ